MRPLPGGSAAHWFVASGADGGVGLVRLVRLVRPVRLACPRLHACGVEPLGEAAFLDEITALLLDLATQ